MGIRVGERHPKAWRELRRILHNICTGAAADFVSVAAGKARQNLNAIQKIRSGLQPFCEKVRDTSTALLRRTKNGINPH